MGKIILFFVLIVFLISGCESKAVGTKIVNPESFNDCKNCIENGFYWCDGETDKCGPTSRLFSRYECEGDLNGSVVSDLNKC